MLAFILLSASALALGTQVAAEPWLKVEDASVTECGFVRFSWGGGKGPYRFTAYAPLMRSSATYVNPNAGSSQVQLSYPARLNGSEQNTQAVFTLQDADGNFAPPSKVMTVRPNTGPSCTYNYVPDFFFAIFNSQGNDFNSTNQCDVIQFSTKLDGNANKTLTPPFTLRTIVPGQLVYQADLKGLTWDITAANLGKEAQVLYSVRDSLDLDGGTGPLIDLHTSPNASCSNEGNAWSKDANKPLSAGAIAGVVIAVVIAIAALTAVALFLWRRRSARSKDSTVSLDDRDCPPPVPFNGGYTSLPSEPATYAATYFKAPNRGSSQGYESLGLLASECSTAAPSAPRPTSSSGNSTVAASEPQQPIYRIQTDAGSVSDSVAVIDMPPTYNPDWQSSRASSIAALGSGLSPLSELKELLVIAKSRQSR